MSSKHSKFRAPSSETATNNRRPEHQVKTNQNYRPISLLSQLGKVMERCVHKHIFNYKSENSLLTPFQSGFIQGDSTTFQLLHTYHSFLEAGDSGKEVRVVFCDISKAFDRVLHKGLLHKTSLHGYFWLSSPMVPKLSLKPQTARCSEWDRIHLGRRFSRSSPGLHSWSLAFLDLH